MTYNNQLAHQRSIYDDMSAELSRPRLASEVPALIDMDEGLQRTELAVEEVYDRLMCEDVSKDPISSLHHIGKSQPQYRSRGGLSSGQQFSETWGEDSEDSLRIIPREVQMNRKDRMRGNYSTREEMRHNRISEMRASMCKSSAEGNLDDLKGIDEVVDRIGGSVGITDRTEQLTLMKRELNDENRDFTHFTGINERTERVKAAREAAGPSQPIDIPPSTLQ
jgi:hypothetical protein